MFCKIARKEEIANLIYEDDSIIVFLDINPVNEGHTLVIPKEHLATIYDLHDEDVAHLFKIVRRIAIAVKKGVNAEGIVITQRNGKAAGQRIPHLHVHVIPRYEGQILPRGERIQGVSYEELNKVAIRIRQFI